MKELLQIARVLLACACLLAAAAAARAEPVPFDGTATLVTVQSSGVPFASLEAGDIDRDGDLDLLASLAGASGQVIFLENLGGASSWNNTVDVTGIGSADGAALLGDVDGDGDPDAVYASGGGLVWARNDGGSWSPQAIPTLGDAPLALGDLDGDGDLDLLAGDGASLFWVDNDSAGTNWTARASFGTTPDAASLGDVDGDGDLDVAVVRSTGFGWLQNTGAGASWSAEVSIGSADAGSDAVLADMDRDGKLDLVAASGGADDEVSWFRNDGTPLGPTWVETSIATFSDPVQIAAADLDRDGDPDVAVVGGASTVWVENTDGAGVVWTTRSGLGGGAKARVLAADLDGDGDPDLVYGEGAEDEAGWFQNREIHNSSLFPSRPSIDPVFSNRVRLLDADGDGDLDAAAWDWSGVRYYANSAGDGSAWSAAVTVDASAPQPDGAFYPSVGDMDGDGDPDLLSVSETDGRAVWYENQSGGATWVEHLIDDSRSEPTSIVAADFDGDGDLDPAVTFEGGSELVVYENDGLSFGNAVSVFSGDVAQGLATGDVDGDGRPDLVVARVAASPNGKIAFFRSLGNLSFEPAVPVSNHNGASPGIALTDLDGDGDLDALACFFDGSYQVRWFENQNGVGTSWGFETLATGTSFVNCRELQPGDLDSDGDVDIAVAAGSTLWLENDGSQSFALRADPFAGGSSSLALGDIDRDGKVDLLSGRNSNSVGITWRPNCGGQYALPTVPGSDGWAFDGQNEVVLDIDGFHRGRFGDALVLVETLELRVEDDLGNPLTQAELDALFSSITVSGSSTTGSYDEGTGVYSLDFTAGNLLPAPPAPGGSAVNIPFPILVDLQASASSAPKTKFQFIHLTESTPSARDQSGFVPVELELHADTASGVIQVLDPAGDEDGDGLSNQDEADIHDTDPFDADSDDDGLDDFDEVNAHGTDPNDADSDDDGLSDFDEVITHGTDPNDDDSDDDGLSDFDEVALGTDPLLEDTDADGVCDGPGEGTCSVGPDNCPFVQNPGQTDSDAFPPGDACQCGNVDGAFGVAPADLTLLRQWLLGGPVSPDLDFCDVNDDGDCDLEDVFVLDHLLQGGSGHAIQDTCAGYTGGP